MKYCHQHSVLDGMNTLI